MFRGLATYPNRAAGALLVAIAVAIAVNALELQTARHPAPFFSRAVAPGVAAPGIAPAPQSAVRETAPISGAVSASNDPLGQFIRHGETASRQMSAAPEPVRRADPISQILHETAQPSAKAVPQPSRTVIAAQRALMKLGYVLEPDGIEGEATRKAILRYEADHHLAERGELTPNLIHALSRASNIAIP